MSIVSLGAKSLIDDGIESNRKDKLSYDEGTAGLSPDGLIFEGDKVIAGSLQLGYTTEKRKGCSLHNGGCSGD